MEFGTFTTTIIMLIVVALVLRTPPITIDEGPAFATPAPISPPMRACELLDGMPKYQVMTFQAIAPIRAPKITWLSTTPGSTMPLPTVAATFSSKIRMATKLKNAAQITAW